MNLAEELKKIIDGDVSIDNSVLETHSYDASICAVRPAVVVFPKHANDIKALVNFVREHKAAHPELSLTVRAAGTCMSGGSLNESIIADTTKYMKGDVVFESNPHGTYARVLPGTMYRDFEQQTKEKGFIMPSYPASKNLCAVGGMVGNNCGGEKNLGYGKTELYVSELKMVLRDGNEYTFKPLSTEQLIAKKMENTLEGEVYLALDELILRNFDLINGAKPQVSKNSSGYFLWNVIDRDAGVFNINRLLTGSQGTLGIITEIVFKLVPVKKYSRMLVLFLQDLAPLGDLVKALLQGKPESIESFDDQTIALAVKYFPDVLKMHHGKSKLAMLINFIPEFWMSLTKGFPKLILLAEFAGDDEQELEHKIQALNELVKHFGIKTKIVRSEDETDKYWTIRRESFNLLRKHMTEKKAASFIEDVVVRPEHVAQFLPELNAVLHKHNLTYSIAGHAGDGNFHIFPLINFKSEAERQSIFSVADQVFALVRKYKGSNSGEHNDGLVRTPYLHTMFSQEILDLFKKTKKIFDPENIFNPGKKVAEGLHSRGSLDYVKSHIIQK